jgi:serine/threonine-protein kinase HipA
MRQALITYNNTEAGILTETDEGIYVFEYNIHYTQAYPKQFLTFSMPVTTAPYTDKRLFSVFEGLIPEGWLLDIATDNWKINRNDRMGLLLACCQNCIGAISVIPITKENDE